jgi:hypothetical protein
MPDANERSVVTIPGADALSIRDHFAAAALQGMLANGPSGGGPGWMEAIAALAYQLGDAMVRAR